MEFYNDKLREIRKKSGLSLIEISNSLCINRVTLAAWEQGKRVPSETKIRGLAKAMNISVDKISDLAPSKEISPSDISAPVRSLISQHENLTRSHTPQIDSILQSLGAINQDLKNSKMLIDALTSSLPFMFYVRNHKMNYILANNNFLKHIGLDNISLLQHKSDSDIFPETEAHSNQAEDNKVLLTGQPILNRISFIPGSRKRKWGLISKVPMLDTDGKIKGLVGSFQDITELKKAEAELTSKESFLRKVLNNINAYIFVVDICPDGQFRYADWNSVSETLVDLKTEMLPGYHTPMELFGETSGKILHDKYMKCVKEGDIRYKETYKSEDGVTHLYDTTLTLIKNDEGIPYQIIGFSINVTKV